MHGIHCAGGAQAHARETAAHHPSPPPQEVQVCGAVQQAHQGESLFTEGVSQR